MTILKVTLGVLIGRIIYDCVFCDVTDIVRYKLYSVVDKFKHKEIEGKESKKDTVYNKTEIGFKM